MKIHRRTIVHTRPARAGLRTFITRPIAAATLAAMLLGGGTARAQASEAASTPRPWHERISFSGDFRNRYEGFFQEGRPSRNRDRFRFRLAMRAEVTDEVTFGLRLASGDPGKPTSSNQSFTEFFSRKPIAIDRAFITYAPKGFAPLSLGAGKFGYPVARTQMLWDDDVNWEGVYQQLAWDVGDRASVTFVAVQSPIAESSRSSDTFMLAGYGQIDVTAGRVAVRLSAANYRFLDADRIAVAFDEGDLRTQNTNLVTRNAAGAVTGFASEFNLVDIIGQTTIETGRAEYPLVLLANVVKNTRATTDQDVGLWLSGTYGRGSRAGTLRAGYTFARIEQDANVSSFAFSDIPGSNSWVHIPAVTYAPWNRIAITFTALITKPIESVASRRDDWLTRIQGDVSIRF